MTAAQSRCCADASLDVSTSCPHRGGHVAPLRQVRSYGCCNVVSSQHVPPLRPCFGQPTSKRAAGAVRAVTILPHASHSSAASRTVGSDKHIHDKLGPVLLERAMPALDEHPPRPQLLKIKRQGLQVVRRANVLRCCAAALLEEEDGLGNVGRQERCLGEEVGYEGVDGRGGEQGCPRG